MNYEENENLFKKISKNYCLGLRHHSCFQLFKNENIKSILDIGCLNGDFLTLFDKNVDKYGVDLKKPKKLIKNIKFKKTDLNKKIPFSNKKFDAI